MSGTEDWLKQFVDTYAGVAGTVHRRSGEDELTLEAAVSIPPPVLAVIQRIPRGKGMAGLALEREAPVHTCNLQSDESGDVRPGAKAVEAQAAVALPIIDEGRVVAVVGIAFAGEKTLEPGELERLSVAARQLPS